MTPKKQPRDQISARLDTSVLEVVQHVAETERWPISNTSVWGGLGLARAPATAEVANFRTVDSGET